MPITATLPPPVSKDILCNYLSQPSVVLLGDFVEKFNYSQDYPIIYTSFLTNVYDTKSSQLIFDINSSFDDIVYKASIRDYKLPDKSLKAIFNGIYAFLNSKKIAFENSFPLYEGGIGLDFRTDSVRYLIEIFNDNEDVFSIEEIGQPIKAWDLNHPKLLNKLSSVIG